MLRRMLGVRGGGARGEPECKYVFGERGSYYTIILCTLTFQHWLLRHTGGHFMTWEDVSCRGDYHQIHHSFYQKYTQHSVHRNIRILPEIHSVLEHCNIKVPSVPSSQFSGHCQMFAVDDAMSRCQRLWWIVIWMISPVVCGGSDWWSVVIGKMSWLLIYGHNNHPSHNQSLIGKLLAVYTGQLHKQKHTIFRG